MLFHSIRPAVRPLTAASFPNALETSYAHTDHHARRQQVLQRQARP